MVQTIYNNTVHYRMIGWSYTLVKFKWFLKLFITSIFGPDYFATETLLHQYINIG